MSDNYLQTGNTYHTAMRELQKYDDTEFSEAQYKACGVSVPDDFTGQRIKNAEYKNCKFYKNSFKYAGASGSLFSNCELSQCDINGANMQFCDFTQSTLKSNDKNTPTIISSNLSQSCFYKTTFKDIFIENTSISQSLFLGTHILDSNFRHVTLQDDVFRDAFILNSSFVGCNMEYSELVHVKIENSILPFHQIPYIYGGLQCIANLENTISICSSMQNAPILTQKEYLELLPTFAEYYKEEKEYFPLANIYLYWNQKNTAASYIHEGLKEYIRKREFRKLKSLCKLAVKNGQFNRHDLSGFYFEIVNYFMSIELDPNEQYQFGLHIDEIRNILLDVASTEKSNIILALKTNLTSENVPELAELISLIEDCFQYNHISNDEYSLEIKHNSPPFSIWIMANSIDPNLLIMFIGMLHSICSGRTDILQEALAVAANLATIGSFINDLLKDSSSNNQVGTSTDLTHSKAVSYALKKHKTLHKKKTRFTLAIGNLHFNYENQKTYQ